MAPSVSHRASEQPSASHTVWWEQYLPNGPTCAHSFEAIIPKRLLLWSFSSDSRDYLLFALQNDWRASEDIPFLCNCAAMNKERKGKTGESHLPTVYAEVEGINQSALNVGKQSQKWKRRRPESAVGFLLVAKAFTSKWRLKCSQNCNKMIICPPPCNRGIITDDLAPFNTSWHGAHRSDLPHPAVFPSRAVQLSCFLTAFSTTQSHSVWRLCQHLNVYFRSSGTGNNDS